MDIYLTMICGEHESLSGEVDAAKKLSQKILGGVVKKWDIMSIIIPNTIY